MKTLLLDQNDSCTIEQIPVVSMEEKREEDIYILTISSLLFKVMTIFHVGNDPQIRDYFLSLKPEVPFSEVFFEICNLCSGAMNQELLRYFPHLGMSTPYLLNGRCFSSFSELKAGYVSHHDITINACVRLQATLYLCGYAPIDFAADKEDIVDTSGELEFF